jgi:hypothetical protein
MSAIRGRTCETENLVSCGNGPGMIPCHQATTKSHWQLAWVTPRKMVFGARVAEFDEQDNTGVMLQRWQICHVGSRSSLCRLATVASACTRFSFRR